MKLRFRLLVIAFVISFLFAVGLSLVSINQFNSLRRYTYWVEHTYKVMDQLNVLKGALDNIELSEKGYNLSGNEDIKGHLALSLAMMEAAADSVKLLITDNKTQQQKMVLLRSDLVQVTDQVHGVMHDTAYSSTIISRPLLQDCIRQIDSIRYEERRLLGIRNRDLNAYQDITSSSVKRLSLMFSLLTLASFLLMIYELMQRMRFQTQLQLKITELRRSQNELEQIAYASSHDLQEPLRKIRIFVDKLLHQHGNELNAGSREILERVSGATERMKGLIEDLMNLTSLVKNNEPLQKTDLNQILLDVREELSGEISARHASIHAAPLPVIQGYPRQLHVLFQSVLNNALKFSKPGIPPEIQILCDKVQGEELHEPGHKPGREDFYCICIKDNGIGFDNKFSGKIFQIFQRLHNQEAGYEGKGIGLAMAMRVMVNHQGHIVAYGHVREGATFKLYFPVRQKNISG